MPGAAKDPGTALPPQTPAIPITAPRSSIPCASAPVPQPLCNAACTAGHRQQLPCPSWHTCLKLQHKQGKQWADSQTSTLTPASITTRRQHHLPHNRPAAPLFAENTARLNPRMSVSPVCLTSLPPRMFACWSHLPASPPCLIARLPAGLTCPPHLPASLHVCLPASPPCLLACLPVCVHCFGHRIWRKRAIRQRACPASAKAHVTAIRCDIAAGVFADGSHKTHVLSPKVLQLRLILVVVSI